MKVQQAFAAHVTPVVFIEQHLPKLAAPYVERFSDFSDVPWPMAVRILGDGGGEWSLRFSDGELEVEEGEGGDEPLVTVMGRSEDWGPVRAQLEAWAGAFERWIELAMGRRLSVDARYRLTAQRLKQLRKVEGKVQMSTHGIPGMTKPLKTTILLNSFDDSGVRSLDIDVQHADLVSVLNAQTDPQAFMQSGRIKMSGNVTLPMKLAGVFMAY